MYKQVIVIRVDLKMGKGKVASQVAHASYSSVKKARKKIVEEWENEGQKKVILKVADEKELIELEKKCRKMKISCALIMDAGHTQVSPGTVTALGIGPERDDKIDEITGRLSLLG